MFNYRPYSRLHSATALLAAALLAATGCKPDGFINKVKYNGQKYVNTCETFGTAVQKTILNNNDPNLLKISAYDNTDFTYYYLEPGQFEIKGDTLYFRLAQDLDYGRYLAKGVSVHVNASYRAASGLASLDTDAEGNIGTLVVNQAYFEAHRKPFFLYKMPLNGKTLAGRQVLLTFAIVKYDKAGNVKQYFCETDATPLGTASPACCTALPWQPAQLQSHVELPRLDPKTEKFVYEGFTGTIDVMFQEGSFKVSDDSSFSASIIQNYVGKYKDLNYRPTYLDLSGYASPGGKEDRNQKLSQQRADALREGLSALSEEGLTITASGRGEDWDRVKLLTMISSLSTDQKGEVLAICNDAALNNDQKEARLRKLPYWTRLVDEVLVKARHTFAVMDFVNRSNLPTIGRYTQRLPLASLQLEEVAKTVVQAQPYREGSDVAKELATLEDLLTKTATPNLYVLRSTYFAARKDYAGAIADLERAGRFRDASASQYSLAIQGYQVLFADTLSFEEKRRLYEDFSSAYQQSPASRGLAFNRLILMDKLGYLSAALPEYQRLFGAQAAGAEQLNNRGVAKLKANMFTEAEADFLAALAQKPDLAQAHYNLAAIYAYRGLTRKTLESLDKAIAADPENKGRIFGNPVFKVVLEDPRFDKYR